MMATKEQKQNWIIDFATYVNELSKKYQYSFVTENTLDNIMSDIHCKNKELIKVGCPEFAFTLEYDEQSQNIQFTLGGIYTDNRELIDIDTWLQNPLL